MCCWKNLQDRLAIRSTLSFSTLANDLLRFSLQFNSIQEFNSIQFLISTINFGLKAIAIVVESCHWVEKEITFCDAKIKQAQSNVIQCICCNCSQLNNAEICIVSLANETKRLCFNWICLWAKQFKFEQCNLQVYKFNFNANPIAQQQQRTNHSEPLFFVVSYVKMASESLLFCSVHFYWPHQCQSMDKKLFLWRYKYLLVHKHH